MPHNKKEKASRPVRGGYHYRHNHRDEEPKKKCHDKCKKKNEHKKCRSDSSSSSSSNKPRKRCHKCCGFTGSTGTTSSDPALVIFSYTGGDTTIGPTHGTPEMQPFTIPLYDNTNGAYNVTTGIFTAPVTGVYQFYAGALTYITNIGASSGYELDVYLYKNGNEISFQGQGANQAPGSFNPVLNPSTLIVLPLLQGDQVRAAVQGYTNLNSSGTFNFIGTSFNFSGQQLAATPSGHLLQFVGARMSPRRTGERLGRNLKIR